jgi:hypothetical protein
MMETKELYKGDETVVVDAGSDAEKYWKGEGYSEEKAKPNRKHRHLGRGQINKWL